MNATSSSDGPVKGDQRNRSGGRAIPLHEAAGDDGDRRDLVAHLAADAVRHASTVGEAGDVDASPIDRQPARDRGDERAEEADVVHVVPRGGDRSSRRRSSPTAGRASCASPSGYATTKSRTSASESRRDMWRTVSPAAPLPCSTMTSGYGSAPREAPRSMRRDVQQVGARLASHAERDLRGARLGRRRAPERPAPRRAANERQETRPRADEQDYRAGRAEMSAAMLAIRIGRFVPPTETR